MPRGRRGDSAVPDESYGRPLSVPQGSDLVDPLQIASEGLEEIDDEPVGRRSVPAESGDRVSDPLAVLSLAIDEEAEAMAAEQPEPTPRRGIFGLRNGRRGAPDEQTSYDVPRAARETAADPAETAVAAETDDTGPRVTTWVDDLELQSTATDLAAVAAGDEEPTDAEPPEKPAGGSRRGPRRRRRRAEDVVAAVEAAAGTAPEGPAHDVEHVVDEPWDRQVDGGHPPADFLGAVLGGNVDDAEADRVEHERIAAEATERGRLEQERDEAELAERARLAAERAEEARLASEHAELERRAGEEAEERRLAAERAEAARIERERVAAQVTEDERMERLRLAELALEEQRLSAEQAERDRIEAERSAAQTAEDVRLEQLRLDAIGVEQQRLTAEASESARAEVERIEALRTASEHAERERLEALRVEETRVAAEREEAQRLAAEEAERQRIAAERAAAEQAEAERLAATQADAERLAAERAETERRAALEARRQTAFLAQQERIAAQRAEKERVAAEHAEWERQALERTRKAAAPRAPRPGAAAAALAGELVEEPAEGPVESRADVPTPRRTTPRPRAISGEPIPRFVEFRSGNVLGYVFGTLFTVFSVGAVLAILWAVSAGTGGAILGAASLTALSMVSWWALLSWSPPVVSISNGLLEISRGSHPQQWDLRDPSTEVTFRGRSSSRSWKAIVRDRHGKPVTIPARTVDAAQFTELVEHYQALGPEAEDSQ